MSSPDEIMRFDDDRFSRLKRIDWWDQDRLQSARVLVIGAGALGNEVIKNLALLGVGNITIVDMDTIETSNLCRSILFRASDKGKSKARVAADMATEIYPTINAVPIIGNLMSDVGLGWFRWADVVVGALDNREARVAVNSYSAVTGKTWIDGGIEVLNGIVRGFAPPATACYECTMGERDWEILNQKRSCSLLARNAQSNGGAPTTATTASVIGAIQAQEVVKRLHGLESLSGAGYVFEGLGHGSYQVEYSINPVCPWHETASPIEDAAQFSGDTRLADIWAFAKEKLGGLDAIDFSREIVTGLHCPACNARSELFRSIEYVTEKDAICGECDRERVPEFLHSINQQSPHINKSVRELGLPSWDVVWARRDDAIVGIEMSGDSPDA